MEKNTDIRIDELIKENERLSEQNVKLKEMLILAYNALEQNENFLSDLKSEFFELKLELNEAKRTSTRIDNITQNTWYGKIIRFIYRCCKKIKQILLHK